MQLLENGTGKISLSEFGVWTRVVGLSRLSVSEVNFSECFACLFGVWTRTVSFSWLGACKVVCMICTYVCIYIYI